MHEISKREAPPRELIKWKELIRINPQDTWWLGLFSGTLDIRLQEELGGG